MGFKTELPARALSRRCHRRNPDCILSHFLTTFPPPHTQKTRMAHRSYVVARAEAQVSRPHKQPAAVLTLEVAHTLHRTIVLAPQVHLGAAVRPCHARAVCVRGRRALGRSMQSSRTPGGAPASAPISTSTPAQTPVAKWVRPMKRSTTFDRWKCATSPSRSSHPVLHHRPAAS